jgi:hypothetical protein
MAEKKEDKVADNAAKLSPYCPIDGTKMVKGTVDGILCWVCPLCGYYYPC